MHDSCAFLILFRAHCGAQFCVRAFGDLRLTCATMFIDSRINNCQSFIRHVRLLSQTSLWCSIVGVLVLASYGLQTAWHKYPRAQATHSRVAFLTHSKGARRCLTNSVLGFLVANAQDEGPGMGWFFRSGYPAQVPENNLLNFWWRAPEPSSASAREKYSCSLHRSCRPSSALGSDVLHWAAH